MQPTEQLEHIIPDLIRTVERIDPMQLHEPTPCAAFTVHDVLDHMIVLGGSFAHWFRGEPAPAPSAPPVYGRVPATEFATAMEDLLAAVQSPGAMERVISAPVGELPGETFARFVAFDGLVHGWDLASSTGQPWEPRGDVVATVDAFARAAITPDLRDGDRFKDPTDPPAHASPIERLVAFSGRTL